MDVARRFGVEVRTVQDVEYEGQPARAVEGSRLYATDPADLWDALTNPERLPRWFLPVRGELKLGGRYQLEGNAGGTITRCEPPAALDVTWEFGGNTSWVSVRLTPEGDAARLTLVHTQLQDDAAEAHWATYGPGATGVGWDFAFCGLGLHLDSGGGAVDETAFHAWLASEPGKVFIRECATAWGAAHVAAGEAPAVANEVAARTAAFYSGE